MNFQISTGLLKTLARKKYLHRKAKGRVQKPPARKLSMEGGGTPLSVNFFPLGFREPTVRGGGGTPPFH